ncbi:hypothetical protein C6P45_004083 [Maudiozyma exigua]|uniref:Uncharacterized protein n=1 Tax=Maudiozyma exigua TaxID=34358 RepID=A0A9P6WH36_MAUEX|nr:hypothetical protein C6P45_004083 [Kazachstania exigua]
MTTSPDSSTSTVFAKKTTSKATNVEQPITNDTNVHQKQVAKPKVSPRKGNLFSKNGTNNSEVLNMKRHSTGTSSLQRSVFKSKKTVDHFSRRTRNQKNIQLQLRDKFASPTDTLLSPCSRKLNDHKTKFLLTKSNPTKLAFGETKKVDSDESMLDFLSDYKKHNQKR